MDLAVGLKVSSVGVRTPVVTEISVSVCERNHDFLMSRRQSQIVTKKRYMVSGTRCPSVCVCSDVVNGRGAAAPEGQMTYDSTQDDFLRFPNSEF